MYIFSVIQSITFCTYFIEMRKKNSKHFYDFVEHRFLFRASESDEVTETRATNTTRTWLRCRRRRQTPKCKPIRGFRKISNCLSAAVAYACACFHIFKFFLRLHNSLTRTFSFSAHKSFSPGEFPLCMRPSADTEKYEHEHINRSR